MHDHPNAPPPTDWLGLLVAGLVFGWLYNLFAK